MENPVALVIETDGVLHQALLLRAAKEGNSLSDVVNGILRQALAAEVDEATGTPPLAEVIQAHHKRQLRGASTLPPRAAP
jgi:plasmid stability protein